MRKSTIYLAFISGCITVLAFLLLVHPNFNAKYFEKSLKQKQQLVKKLKITDLCLFTEARYTRHLSQADLFAAFQDHPMAFEHFPSGSLVLPPILIHHRDR
jgi:type II secretory pathway component PulC